MENLLSVIPGTWFRALLQGDKVVGQIQVEDGVVFLCQADHAGSQAENKLGWPFSWNIDDGSSPDGYDVRDFELLAAKPEGYIKPVSFQLNEDYPVIIWPGYIMVGCQRIENAVVQKVAENLIPERNNNFTLPE